MADSFLGMSLSLPLKTRLALFIGRFNTFRHVPRESIAYFGGVNKLVIRQKKKRNKIDKKLFMCSLGITPKLFGHSRSQ